MSLLVVGLSHRSAPADLLERVAESCADRGKVLDQLLECEHVSEALLLCTCQPGRGVRGGDRLSRRSH
jgi:glutamyl-tRNA reductase